MADRYFLMTLHREWIIKVPDGIAERLGPAIEDAVFNKAVFDFLNVDLSDQVDVEELGPDDDEVVFIGANSDEQSWDYEVSEV